jgi:hypothetical protein
MTELPVSVVFEPLDQVPLAAPEKENSPSRQRA